jgi:selenocysteine lyase/cysteine desulfurase
MDLARVAELYPPPPNGLAYLDTASYGLTPVAAQQALRSVLDSLASGTAEWQTIEKQADQARSLFARLIHANPDEVALVPAASAALATVLASVPHDAEILLCPDDHSSVTLPAHARSKTLRLRWSPFAGISDATSDETTLIACSHVRYDNGQLADVAAIAAAAAQVGAALYLDATQSLGALAIDVHHLGVDYLACAAYKWLSCPRGVAFLWVAPHRLEQLTPLAPSRRSTTAPLVAAPIDSSELAATAAKLDMSLSWLPWAAAPHCLEALLSIDEHERERVAVGLAGRLATALNQSAPQSAICALRVSDAAQAAHALTLQQVKATVHSDSIRLSPHIYNSNDDVDRAAAALAPYIRARTS